MSETGLPLMGGTAGIAVSAHVNATQFLAEYVTKTNSLTCVLTTSKHQEDSVFKDSHPKCFIATIFEKFFV